MVTNRLEKKSVKKTILTATAVIGTSALLFMGVLQVVSASELEKGGEVESTDLPEVGNITPELPNPVGAVLSDQTEGETTVVKEVPSAHPEEGATVVKEVPSVQPEEEAIVEKEVPSAQPEDGYPSEAYLLNNR